MILQVRYVLASVVSSSHWHPQAQLSQRNKYIRAKKKEERDDKETYVCFKSHEKRGNWRNRQNRCERETMNMSDC